MITPSSLCLGSIPSVAVLAAASTLLAFPVTRVFAASGPGAADYVVYLGLDVTVDHQGVARPVIAGSEAEVRVQTDTRPVAVPLRNAALKTVTEPKLSRTRAVIEEVAAQQVYSLNNDPTLDAMGQQMVMETAQSHAQEIAAIEANAAQQNAVSMERAAAQPNTTVTQADVEAANRGAVNAATNLNTAYVAPAFRTALPGGGMDNATYDGFEVSFRVSSQEAYEDAYGVLRLMVRDPGNPQAPAQVVRFFNVRNLGPKPRKVAVRQFGLPHGFAVDSYSVHIYTNGREIPTNLSRNRFDVSEDEAHQFIVLRHVHENRQANIPAQVIPEFAPAELRTLTNDAVRGLPVDLEIDAAGKVTRIVPPAGASSAFAPNIEAALLRVRLMPALQNGTPVASRGTFMVGDFVR